MGVTYYFLDHKNHRAVFLDKHMYELRDVVESNYRNPISVDDLTSRMRKWYRFDDCVLVQRLLDTCEDLRTR